ncbi:hypothetical protein [Serratia nevei]|uniref:hypothetical protein n=1 Tax=Serratia nevei TaxID=2703794 RepID=UPI00301A2820
MPYSIDKSGNNEQMSGGDSAETIEKNPKSWIAWKREAQRLQKIIDDAANREARPAEWSGWACQFPGHMPQLYGDKAIAEINCDYDGGARLLFLSSATPAPANAVAWEMRYWNNGYNCWHEWERITAEQHAEMSTEHAADNDYEFRVLYDAPPGHS